MVKTLVSLGHTLLFTAISIAGIGFVIGFHELGHFLFCKLFGIRTQTFSIGFGPQLITKKIGDTDFSLSAIPLGGYVDLSNPEGKEDDQHSFSTRPYWQKVLVMLGGIGFNVLFAYLALSLVFMLGMPATPALFPDNATTTIRAVAPNSASALAGLKAGDKILKINGTPIENNVREMLALIKPLAKQPVNLTIERDGQQLEIATTVEEKKVQNETISTLNVDLVLTPLPALSFFQAIKRGIQLTNDTIIGTFNAFKYLFSSADTTNLAGPVSIFAATMKGAASGLKVFLIFLAIISVNLAILNLIPLPILDGGQVLFYTIESIIGKSIPDKVREYIFIATWLAFLALTIYLTGKDITRLAGDYIDAILKFFGLK